MEVALSAWGKRSRTTGKTFGAALGATRGSGGSDGLYVGKTENCASRPLRGGSRSAAFPFQPKCSSLCGCSMPTEMQMLPLQRDLNCKCCPFRETERDASRSVAFPFQQKCCSLCGWPPSIINIHIIRRRPKRSISISTEVLLPLLLAPLYY